MSPQNNNYSSMPPNLIAGLDIGTTKICMVAALVQNKEIEIIGTGVSTSHGLKKGIIVNRESTIKSILHVIDECQKKCGYEIKNVCVGIAGDHIEGINSHGVVSVKNEIIGENDIIRVIDSAKPACPENKVSIHILTQNYTVDYQSGFDNPIGITGKRLEANVHVVLAASNAITNITRSCSDAGLNVDRIVLEPYASALSVLNDDEKELGVLLLDIGGGTTDMLVYKDQSILISKVIPIGGANVTHDISIGLVTSRNYAENIKKQEGSAYAPTTSADDIIEITSIAGHPTKSIPRKTLAEIIEPRYTEIFETAINELVAKGISFSGSSFKDDHGNKKIKELSGIVLTGGGSNIRNLNLLAENIFKAHTRIGYPDSHVQGANDFVKHPAYATAVGLLKYIIQDENADFVDSDSKKTNTKTQPKNREGFLEFIKHFFN